MNTAMLLLMLSFRFNHRIQVSWRVATTLWAFPTTRPHITFFLPSMGARLKS